MIVSTNLARALKTNKKKRPGLHFTSLIIITTKIFL